MTVNQTVENRLDVVNMLFLLGTLAVTLVGVPWYIVKVGLGWPETITFAVLWLTIGVSVTAGYHRLFSHRTYRAAWPVRLFFLVFGAAALENSALRWSADHRVHHSHTDHDRDPYNIQKGFWWAHMGWVFFHHEAPSLNVVRDLQDDPLVLWQDRWNRLLGLGLSFGVPLVVGLATGRVLGCLLIGGVARVVASHHATFFINSLCHMIGRQPYSREHSARDSAVMALLALGEGYHNFHHSFPFDYRNGVKPWHFDPAKWVIFALSKLGLARELRRAPDALLLRARVGVQFEHARERLAQLVGELRQAQERRLHDAHAAVQARLQELLALQRRARGALAAEVDEGVLACHRAVEQALHEWRLVLEQLRSAEAVPA
ncbi:MAG TPA: fatty acid desaturase [Thermoanaerobaculia bacterium]